MRDTHDIDKCLCTLANRAAERKWYTNRCSYVRAFIARYFMDGTRPIIAPDDIDGTYRMIPSTLLPLLRKDLLRSHNFKLALIPIYSFRRTVADDPAWQHKYRSIIMEYSSIDTDQIHVVYLVDINEIVKYRTCRLYATYDFEYEHRCDTVEQITKPKKSSKQQEKKYRSKPRSRHDKDSKAKKRQEKPSRKDRDDVPRSRIHLMVHPKSNPRRKWNARQTYTFDE